MKFYLIWIKLLSSIAELAKDYEKCARYWIKITILFPDRYDFFTTTATFLALTNKNCEAEIFLKSALKLNPSYSPALFNLGFLKQKKNEHSSAVIYFSQSIDNDPKLDRAYFGRGISYMKINKYDMAIKDFNKTIELQPYGPHAYYYLCIIMNKIKRNSEAKKIIDKLLNFEPQIANQLKKELNL